ncbi:MAG: hypothetical protein ACPG7F_14700 [Aggregatilineales bacterium]
MTVLPHLYTTTEFETFIASPENRERLFELIHGEIVEKVPAQRHGMIAAKVTIALGIYLEKIQLADPVWKCAIARKMISRMTACPMSPSHWILKAS